MTHLEAHHAPERASAPTCAGSRPPAGGMLRLVSGAMLLSFAPVFVKLAHVGPTPAAFYRMAIGGAVLAGWVVLTTRSWWAGRAHLWMSVLAGTFLALDLAVWHRSINLVGPGLSTLLANLQVFVLAGFGAVFLRERVTLRLAAGIGVAVAGLYLVFGRSWGTLGSGYRSGVVFGVLTAVCYASYLLTLRSARGRGRAVDAVVTVATLSVVSAVLLAGSVVIEGETFRIPGATDVFVLIAYAIVPQVIAWVLVSSGLPSVPASRAGLVLLLQPSLAFVWDVAFFRRPTTALEAAGVVVALGGIYLGSRSTA